MFLTLETFSDWSLSETHPALSANFHPRLTQDVYGSEWWISEPLFVISSSHFQNTLFSLHKHVWCSFHAWHWSSWDKHCKQDGEKKILLNYKYKYCFRSQEDPNNLITPPHKCCTAVNITNKYFGKTPLCFRQNYSGKIPSTPNFAWKSTNAWLQMCLFTYQVTFVWQSWGLFQGGKNSHSGFSSQILNFYSILSKQEKKRKQKQKKNKKPQNLISKYCFVF